MSSHNKQAVHNTFSSLTHVKHQYLKIFLLYFEEKKRHQLTPDKTIHVSVSWLDIIVLLMVIVSSTVGLIKQYWVCTISLKNMSKEEWSSYIIWDIMPCSSLKVNQGFRATCHHHLQVEEYAKATCSSKMSVYFQRTTQCYIPENWALHNHHCENLKPYKNEVNWISQSNMT
jgi:hypothetical protein